MGLKSLETSRTSVLIPSEVRIALKSKGWTILDAIKNGINFSGRQHHDIFGFDDATISEHPHFQKILKKLRTCRRELDKYENLEEYEEDDLNESEEQD